MHESRTARDRAAELVRDMTVDEKLAQLSAVNFPDLVTNGRFDEDAALAVMPHGAGEVTRIGATTGLTPSQSAELFNQVQRLAVERTRLGIPVVVHEESLAGYCARDATVFPQALSLAASWSPDLVGAVAATIREQLLAVGARHSLAPVLDVARDPRWGRVEETFGESPVLCGLLGTAYVRAMQGDDLTRGVLATGKHFLAHGASEGGRNHAPVNVGPRELREVYAEPFAAAIRDAGLATVMSSYSCIDGLPGSGSPEILTGLLRDELGFDGMVVADYFAVALLHSYHRAASDKSEAAAKALRAGLDMELPGRDCYGEPLRAAMDAGLVGMDIVDRAVTRVLEAKFALGLFESPYVHAPAAAAVFADPAATALARKAAAMGTVMLANDGVLPLGPGIRRVAVIGPCADNPRLLQGDYHYPSHQEGAMATQDESVPTEMHLPSGKGDFRPGPFFTPHVTPLAGLRAALDGRAEITYEPGCDISGEDRSGLPAAVQAAKDADVALVFVGGRSGLDPASTVGESRDATDLRLSGGQEELVREVAASGAPTVVVVVSGRVHALSGVARVANALLYAPPLGQEGGNALADILTGAAEPGGRLPVSLPRAGGQVPLHHAHRSGGSRSAWHGAYTDCQEGPLFCFGHGLGYTEFSLEDFEVRASTTEAEVVVALTVRNVGERPGDEVVQVYASDLYASVSRPERWLVASHRVTIAPAEAARVRFRIHPSRLAFYDERMDFVVEPGKFRFVAGRSCQDAACEAMVELAGRTALYRQRDVPPVVVDVAQAAPCA
ncbi:MAG TPA: glycoside hydrolase family 3 N-terminal domain-containing protein [Acidimicrobiales bacterium]|nr:glycoside hydrolase family 3 N-terminal domain-containing protein [Acidimicrobiales bacterium]